MLIILAKALAVVIITYIAASLILIATQTHKPVAWAEEGLDFSREQGLASESKPVLDFTARDGAKLNYREYGTSSGPLIVVIHGSSAHGGLYESLALGISTLGTIIVPNLRGHGGNTPAGDVSYIGQLEDDLADLIGATQTSPTQPVILVGHSSGGGLIVRYAGNPDHATVDSVVLLAPYLGFNAPTTRSDSGGWAEPLTRRIIGLTMLNALKVRVFNHLPVISFQLPTDSEPLQMTSSYTHRMNESFAPRYDFKKDIAQLPKFKILIGDKDEAFVASEFSPLLNSFKNQGSVEIIEGLSHLDVIGDSAVHVAIAHFIEELPIKN